MIRQLLTPRSGKDAWARTLALVAVIGATLFLMWQSDERSTTNPEAEQLRGPSEPDSFVVDSVYRTWDKQGNLELRLTSPRIEQFEASDQAILEQPNARVYGKPDSPPWIIEADQGSLRQTRGLLDLTGNVVVTQRSEESEVTLVTEVLTLDNREQTAYTDQPVTITEPFGVTQATGMKAWIDQRILELNSRVEGQYETFR